jgi:succinate dehydrogenase/fumarate reductase flavoprotein subunit
MAKRESKLHVVVEHTLWHYTGQPILEFCTNEWKKKGPAGMISAGVTIAGKHAGLISSGWLFPIALIVFGLILGIWHWLEFRHEQAQRPSRSELEEHRLSVRRNELICKSWAQKVALKLICKAGTIHERTLLGQLEHMGFGSGQELMDRVIKGACTNGSEKSGLVEYTPLGMLSPHEAGQRDVEELVNEWNYEFD